MNCEEYAYKKNKYETEATHTKQKKQVNTQKRDTRFLRFAHDKSRALLSSLCYNQIET